MQIEFYLPLPPDGFWAGLMIYYIFGLFVCLYKSIKNYDPMSHHRAFSNTNDITGCVFLAIMSASWPYCLLMNYRNQ